MEDGYMGSGRSSPAFTMSPTPSPTPYSHRRLPLPLPLYTQSPLNSPRLRPGRISSRPSSSGLGLGFDHQHGRSQTNVVGLNGNDGSGGDGPPDDRDMAYMRFVPGLGLRSGAMTFEEDDSDEDDGMRRHGRRYTDRDGGGGGGDYGATDEEDEVAQDRVDSNAQSGYEKRPSKPRGRSTRRIRPRSHSLTDLPSVLDSTYGPWDDEPINQTDSLLTTPSDALKLDPLFLPHFSLDTKFSLPPGVTSTPVQDAPPRPGRTNSGRVERDYSRDNVRPSATIQAKVDPANEEVHFDLGLGKDLDHTIEEAVKRAKAEISGQLKKTVVKVGGEDDKADGGAATGGCKGMLKEEMMKTKEVPLPPEAARVLNEARLQQQRDLLLTGVNTGSKGGRKASMGMGLFKESARVDGVDVPVGREGREKERVERERAAERGEASTVSTPAVPVTPAKDRERGWLSRTSTNKSKVFSEAVSEEEDGDEDQDGQQQDKQGLPNLSRALDNLDLQNLDLGGKRSRKHQRAKTVPAEPVEVLHEKLIKSVQDKPGIAPHQTKSPYRSRASSPQARDRTTSAPSVVGLQAARESRSRMASPAISRVQSRVQPSGKPSVADDSEWPPAADFPHGWTSEDTWESSSGLSSSSGSESDGDDIYESAVESDHHSERQPGRPPYNGRSRALSPPHTSRRSPSYIRQSHLANDQMKHAGLPEHDRSEMKSPQRRIRQTLEEDDEDDAGGEVRVAAGAGSPGDRMTVPLQPFKNKVGGHSEIYKFTRRAVCKVCIE
jgi:hypothetical protein